VIIEKIMQEDVLTLSPDNSILDAVNIIKLKRIRHLPIVDEENHVVGIVSDRDIRDASSSILLKDHDQWSHLLNKPIREIMVTDVITGHPLDFIEDAAALFFEHRISCLPILQNEKLVGIITETDVLHTFVKMMGAHHPSSRIEVRVPNITGMLSEVSAVFHKRKVNISSVFVYPDGDDQTKVLVFRVQTMNPLELVADLKEKGYTVVWPNI
jgi:acetoin utilization protein AcuB